MLTTFKCYKVNYDAKKKVSMKSELLATIIADTFVQVGEDWGAPFGVEFYTREEKFWGDAKLTVVGYLPGTDWIVEPA